MSTAGFHRPRSAPEIEVEVRDLSEVLAIRAEWEDLRQASRATPFDSLDWLESWAQNIGSGEQPCILCAWHEGVLVAALALSLRLRPLHRLLPRPRQSVVSGLGGKLRPWHAAMVRPGCEAAWHALADSALAVVPRGGRLALRDWIDPPGSDPVGSLAAARGARVDLREGPRSVWIDLSSGFEAYLAGRSRHFRKAARQFDRRMTELGGRIVTEIDIGDRALEAFEALSRISWKGKAGSSVAATEGGSAFLQALWRRFGSRGQMHIVLLEIAGRPVSANLLLSEAGVAYSYFVEFDEAFARLSPGLGVVLAGVEHVAKLGARRVDLLRRSEFTRHFSEHEYALDHLVVHPRPTLFSLGDSAARWLWAADARPVKPHRLRSHWKSSQG
jgi:CelD/BcsL family acetyltransferase involved in cellulose biosynthesis